MTETYPLPTMATVKAAYRDVFGNVVAFFKVIWLILFMMVLFVELPMLMIQREVYFSIHPEQRVETTQSSGAANIDVPATEKKDTEENATDKKSAEQSASELAAREASLVHPEHVVLMMGLSLLQLLLVFSFSVAWYRQLLFNDKKDKTILFHFGKMEWNFALTSMKSGLVMAPVMLVLMSYYMASIPGFSEGEPINLAEYWPLFAGGCAVMLYLGSRLSMSYPLTMMGQFDAPIKQSWIMTRAQAGRIALGFMLLVLPVSIVTMIVVLAVSYGMNMGTQALPESGTVSDFDIGFAEHLIYKTIGSTYMLFAFALVSAFYARAYAFLVRSQQGTPSA